MRGRLFFCKQGEKWLWGEECALSPVKGKVWVEDLQTYSFKTICDLVPILKSSYTSRARVPSLEDCFLFGFLKWPVSLKYLGGWPRLDLANLSDLWFLLVFLACVNLGPWLHSNLWIQCPSWVCLPDLSSFSGLLSQQFPWLPNFVTWQLDLSLCTFQKGTTVMITSGVLDRCWRWWLQSTCQSSCFHWLYHEISINLKNTLLSYLEICLLCLLQSVSVYPALFLFTLWSLLF